MSEIALSRASLYAPINRGGPGADLGNTTRPSWVLMDFSAFVIDRHNSTTATCTSEGGKRLQVTFEVAHPPQVSYFCVYCHGLPPSAYSMEPLIIATEADLVLIRLVTGGRSALSSQSAQEFFIYRAGGPQGEPSLEQIPRLKGRFLGIGGRGGGHPVGLLKHDTGYIVAVLGDQRSAIYGEGELGQLEICLFDSRYKVWTTKPVAVSRGDSFHHETSMVITLGGKHGTMAFVDLWRGILLCDVLADEPLLRYIPLPETIFGKPHYSVNPLIDRNIAVVNGRIRYIEMGFEVTTDTAFQGQTVVAAYSMPITSCQKDGWRHDCKIHLSKISDDKNILSPEVQRMLNYDERMAAPEPTMANLCTGHPTHCLHDEDIVYFMTKVKPMSHKACVVAVNIREETVQTVARFGARTRGITSTYIQSRISSYLNIAPGNNFSNCMVIKISDGKFQHIGVALQHVLSYQGCWLEKENKRQEGRGVWPIYL